MAKRNSRFRGSNDEARQAAFEQHQEDLSGKKQARVRLQDGMNIWWVLPELGGMEGAVERLRVHYNPFHVCGRAGTKRNPANTQEELPDNNFSHCYRCSGAWSAYDNAGRPGTKDPKNQNAHKSKFKSDMSTDQGAVQVIDMTFFFKMDGPEPAVDAKLADAHLDDYIAAMNGDSDKLASLPEKLQESAEAGVSIVLVNKDLADKIDDAESYVKRKALKTAKTKAEKTAAAEGPTLYPEGYLLWVDRSDDMNRSFQVNGQTRHPKNYKCEYLTPVELDDWSPDVDSLFAIAEDQALDLSDPREDLDRLLDDPSLDDLARGLVRFNEEEMEEYLRDSGHSFSLVETIDTATEEELTGSADYSDPNSLLTEASAFVGDEESQKEVMEARRKLRNRLSE